MKKLYESPVMMIEGFMPNEYVAACYDIYCRGMKDDMVDGSIVNDKDKHDTHGKIARVQSVDFTTRDIKHSPWGWGWIDVDTDTVNVYQNHWKVEAVDVATAAHPNASV